MTTTLMPVPSPQEVWTLPPGTRLATADEIRDRLKRSKDTVAATMGGGPAKAEAPKKPARKAGARR